MQSYRTINRLCGWVVFIAAAVVYTLTLESSASFWDCPEFITSAARLEVGHSPARRFSCFWAICFPTWRRMCPALPGASTS